MPCREPEPPIVRVLILCGGLGTRAYPHTVDLPKPLLEVAGQPVLRHVMEIFAAQGYDDFVLAAGFKHELISEFAATTPWRTEVVDTGVGTGTGERVRRCRELLGERFLATYADGLGDVDLVQLLERHGAHPGTMTVTIVPLPSPYGTVDLSPQGQVERFLEKPVLTDHWINGGFFVVDAAVFDHWKGEDLEREVLPGLARAGLLFAYEHKGFWRSMDTHKDALELTAMCPSSTKGEGPPWARFATHASS